MPLTDHDRAEIEDMFSRRIEEHVRKVPHHEAPCPHFTTYKASWALLLSVIGTVSVFAWGVNQWQVNSVRDRSETQAKKVEQLTVDITEVRKDIQFVRETVSDIRDALRPGKGYTTP